MFPVKDELRMREVSVRANRPPPFLPTPAMTLARKPRAAVQPAVLMDWLWSTAKQTSMPHVPAGGDGFLCEYNLIQV